jgi:GntR family transcriptional regulator
MAPSGTKLSPLYHQMFIKLRDQIAEGVYTQNDVLPGEFDLAERFGVSRITARRALTELEAHGLVIREQGKKSVVSGTSTVRPLRTSLDDFLQYNRSITEGTKARPLSYDLITPTPHVAALLALGANERVYLHRLVRIRNGPTIYSQTYLPPSIAKKVGRHEVGSEPSITLFKRLGIRVASGEQTISAIAADADAAEILHVPAGSPLMQTERVLFDAKDVPLEFVRMIIRPDRHELSMRFAVRGSAS